MRTIGRKKCGWLFLVFLAASGIYGRAAGVGQVSTPAAGVGPPAGGAWDSAGPIITPDGRYVLFASAANNLVSRAANVPSTNSPHWLNVFLRDRVSGSTTLASVNLTGGATAGAISDWPALSPDGRFVAFLSSATDLVTNSVSGDFQLFVRDLQAGTTTLVNAGPDGSATGLGPESEPRLTPDGQAVAFSAPDGNLVAGDNNRGWDVFVRNLAAATNELISARAAGVSSYATDGSSFLSTALTTADGRHVAPLSTNGQFLVFSSEADDLVAGDTNGCRDVFLRSLLGGTTLAVSVNTNGACNFSFADGHAASKRWTDTRTTPPLQNNSMFSDYSSMIPSPGNLDIAWLQQHATRPQ